MNSICPLLLQSVNRKVFEGLTVDYFTDALRVETAPSINVPVAASLNAEEENTLCYVNKYVVLKLMRKYQKEDSEKSIQFVECLLRCVKDWDSVYTYTQLFCIQLLRDNHTLSCAR